MFAKTSRMVGLATALSFSTIAFPAGPVVQQPVTVGDFAVKVARALGFQAVDAEEAGDRLRVAGVHLDADLKAPLTEGRASDMMRELGVDTRVSGDPSAPMSTLRADQAATAVALGVGQTADRFTSDGGQLPAACTNVTDRMTCNQCCLGILLPVAKYPIRAIVVCAVLCARVFPPNPSLSIPAH
jgi:hypothetical protein